MSLMDYVIQGALDEYARLEEIACEKALQSGTDGVAVVRGDWESTFYVTGLVPYGNLYIFPSQESFEAFRKSSDSEI